MQLCLCVGWGLQSRRDSKEGFFSLLTLTAGCCFLLQAYEALAASGRPHVAVYASDPEVVQERVQALPSPHGRALLDDHQGVHGFGKYKVG